MEVKLKVHACKIDDITTGIVWIPPKVIERRSVVKIENKINGKCVYCEALTVDDNYINYDKFKLLNKDEHIFLNESHRTDLGIDKNKEYLFGITEKNKFYYFHACLFHPQLTIKLSIFLGLGGIILGIIGIILSFVGVYLSLKCG